MSCLSTFERFYEEKYPFTPNKKPRLEDDVSTMTGGGSVALNYQWGMPPTFIVVPQKKDRPIARSYSTGAFIPTLNAETILKEDLRFSKIQQVKINGVVIRCANYSALRNYLLGLFYRKSIRDKGGVPYYKDGLAVKGVGSKRAVVSILQLAKMVSVQIHAKILLRNGKYIFLTV